MRLTPRFFSSSLTRREQIVYRTATILFTAVFLSSIWPVASLFSVIEPRILGIPFSLAYLIILVAVVFVTMLGIYLWQDRRGELD